MTTARDRVATQLELDLPAIVRSIVGSIQAAVPAYRDLRGPQLADVEGIARWSLIRLMQLWTVGFEYDQGDQARFRAIGATRAADGRPLTDILRAYRVASSVFVRHVTDRHLDDLEPTDIAELSLIVLAAVDAISEEVIDAYTASRERLTSDRDQAQAALLDDLIAGRQNSPGAIADRSRELNLRLAGRPHILLIQHSDATRAMSGDELDDIVTALALVPHGRQDDDARRTYVCTRRGTRGVLLLPNDIERSDVESICRAHGLLGCLVTGRPIADVPAVYRLAGDALDTAPAHAFADRLLLDDGDCQLLALLTARPTADTTALTGAVLGPLVEPSNRHLLDGLSAFIATGTATAAAAALHVHPQTLRYRLRRAQKLAGRDPRHAWHRLTLDTAIQLHLLAERT